MLGVEVGNQTELIRPCTHDGILGDRNRPVVEAPNHFRSLSGRGELLLAVFTDSLEHVVPKISLPVADGKK